jgi:hypothetical protein
MGEVTRRAFVDFLNQADICGRVLCMYFTRLPFPCRIILLLAAFAGYAFYPQEVVDYRVILERAFEVMATQTMEYEESAGLYWSKSRTKSIVSQLRNADGTVFRKDEQFLYSERIPREQLKPGCFLTASYYTAEGYTLVFFTRNRVRGIQAKGEKIHRSEIPRKASVAGIEKEVYGVPCWVVRVDRKKVPEGAIATSEYVVEQSTHVIRRTRDFKSDGNQFMVVEYLNFNFSPEFPPGHFALPKFDSLRFVEDLEECLEANEELVKECVEEVGDPSVTRQSQGSWLARRWRAICRNPGRAAFWGLLVASCLCLGTAGVLRRHRS